MITFEVLPEVHDRKLTYSTCRECQHTFYPKSEDQHCLELCDNCIEELRSMREPVISVHVRPRPRLAAR